MASSLASLLLGIPTALLLLSHFGEAQAEARERRRVKQRARVEVYELRGLLRRPFYLFREPDLVARMDELLVLGREFEALVPRWSEDGMRETLTELAGQHWAAWRSLLGTTEPLAEQDRRSQDWVLWSGEVQAQWELLDQDLRPRLAELGISWLPRQDAARLRQAVTHLVETSTPTRLGDRDVEKRHAWLRSLRELMNEAEVLAVRIAAA